MSQSDHGGTRTLRLAWAMYRATLRIRRACTFRQTEGCRVTGTACAGLTVGVRCFELDLYLSGQTRIYRYTTGWDVSRRTVSYRVTTGRPRMLRDTRHKDHWSTTRGCRF